jgi:plastocyanin
MPLTPRVDVTGCAQVRRGRRRPLRRQLTVLAAVTVLLVGCVLASGPASARTVDMRAVGMGPHAAARPLAPHQLQAQVLTWTAGNSMEAYASAPTTAVAGPATIVFENSAATGNTTDMQHTLTFETGNPAYNSDVNVNILADPVDANQGRHTVDVVLTPGTYRYFCALPGHSTMAGLLVVTGGGEDATPPAVTAQVTGEQNEDGAYVGAATVTLSATDSGSGVARVEYAIDGGAYGTYSGPVTVNAPGQHTVSYRATDVAGNTSEPESASFQVVAPPDPDTTAPTVTAQVTGEQNEDGSYAGSATVTLSATDTESGVDRVEYSLDGQPYATYTTPVTVNQAGEHTVSYRATDVAGNTSAPQSVAFQVVDGSDPDTTAPTVTAEVTGEQNEDGAFIGAATVTLTATDDGSGVDSVEYSVDGQPYAAYSAPVTVDQPGEHTVSYRATDVAGNTSEPQSVSFQVIDASEPDTTPPSVTAALTGDQNEDGAYVGAATVTLTATDAESGVDTVEYSVDGQPYAVYTAPVTVNEPGEHTVSYRATDVAGNTSEPQSVSVQVVAPPGDTTPPTVTAALAGQQDGSWAYVGSATVTLDASDTGSGVLRVEYALDGRGYVVYTGPFTVNTVGGHTFSYRATDRAGNVSGTASVTFTVVESRPPPPSCRVADTRPTVWIGTKNTGVPNRAVQGGCWINNLIEDEKPWPSHGEFVAHVKAVAEHLHHRGVITRQQHNILVRTARDSGVGRPEAQQGYQPLLDRSAASYNLWEQVGAGGFRRNADGSITSQPVDGLGMLWFPVREYGDFSLKLQWRDDAPGDGRANSGVFVRFPQVHQHPQEPRPEWVAIKYGHELQIYDRPDGDQYKSGSVYGFDRVDLDGAGVTGKGTWNDYEIRVVGQHYSLFRNGVLINEYVNDPDAVFDPPRPDDPGGAGRQHPTGYIGLQNHGAADIVSFRNVRIAPLTP